MALVLSKFLIRTHTCEYAEAILDSNEAPFSARLQKLLGDEIWNFNLLILDRVEILPKYRGGGVGLLVLTTVIERFGAGAGVVGMKPFPLQLEPSPVIPRGGRNV